MINILKTNYTEVLTYCKFYKCATLPNIMTIIPILRKFDLSNDDKVKLSSLIESRIELETNWVKNPFERKDDMWVMNKETREKHFPTFPSGRYITENQARMALTIHQINSALSYEQLYLLSNVFTTGL